MAGKIIDKNSDNPASQIYEKEIAGGYLYQHFNYLNNQNKLKSSLELSQLAKNNNLKLTPSKKLAQLLLKRSASLVACQIAAIYKFKRQTKKTTRKKLTFIMEGSLFWKGWQYKKNVEKYLEKLAIPKKSIVFNSIKNSSVLGTSHLAG